MNNYCLKGKEMILDLKVSQRCFVYAIQKLKFVFLLQRSDWLPAYDEEGIRTLLAELIEIVQKLSSSMEVLNQPNMPNAVKVRAVYLHQCLIRNHKYING